MNDDDDDNDSLVLADILPLVPAPVSIVVLDFLLRTLTHTNPTRRRSALLLAVLLLLLSARSLLSLHARLKPPVVPQPTPYDLEDSLARSYVPSPPTAQQQANHARLSSLISSRKSAYSHARFSHTALRGDASPVVGVTAVVLHWKRRSGLELVLRHIARYPFIREIIVWNNRPGVDLTKEDFTILAPPDSTLPPASLRIVNSPSNVHDAGKHLACSMATYSHCYFNDDDWLNVYMDTTYTKYLECCAGQGVTGGSEGGRISSNTLPIIHLEHRRWRFSNPDIDLHTGFTWLGTGSFAPRSLSTRFLTQQSVSPVPLSRGQSLTADMFFSTWANTYPEQMPNELVAVDVEGGEVGWSRGEGVDQWAVVYSNLRTALRTLTLTLQLSSSSNPLTPHPFPLAPPPSESLTRAPCANDACLFVTSLTPFPGPEELATSYAEVKAAPEADDHFGLTLVTPRVVKELTLTGSLDLANVVGWEDVTSGSESWEVFSVRGDGTGGWEPRSLLSAPRIVPLTRTTLSVTISLEPILTPTTYALEDEGNVEVDEEGHDVAIRKLKVVSRGRKREPVTVTSHRLVLVLVLVALSPFLTLPTLDHSPLAMLARTAIALTAALAATGAHAQSASSLLNGLSSQCTSAATSLLGSDFASCSQLSGLLSVVTASGSVVNPINTWLGSVCSASNCSTAAITNATSVIDNGCSSELSSGQAIVTAARSVVANFNAVKEGICLQYSSNSTFCITDLLQSVQSATGQQVTLSTLTSLNASMLQSIPSSAVCTDCAHGLVTKLGSALSNGTSSSTQSSVFGAVSSYCGSSFADGQVPSTLKEASSSSNSSSSGNSAVTSKSLSGAVSLGAGSWTAAGAALAGVAAIVALV
ncbi:hypothetical protein Rt10032_c09g3788 [Rhodotorula toruloides]|uniref:DUF7729 domain-containing protein n=1 Tax=Rhodotorula toruloides TaxID=5286 RepID=A0A511KHC0_RHOTO|nr:hypothetical protein Rt10032_c09g3788 [Rhodotorula toruloides]